MDLFISHGFHNRRMLQAPIASVQHVQQVPEPRHTYRRAILDKTLSIAFIIIFFATLSYLIFTSVGHCLRRRRSIVANTGPSDEKSDNSCAQQQLQTMPIYVFGEQLSPSSEKSQTAPPSSTKSSPGSGEAECCSVCLSEYQKGEEMRALPRCKHTFHRECIDQWLMMRSSFCPICRSRVIERATEPTSAGSSNGNGGGGGGGVDQRLNTSLGLNTVISSRVTTVL